MILHPIYAPCELWWSIGHIIGAPRIYGRGDSTTSFAQLVSTVGKLLLITSSQNASSMQKRDGTDSAIGPSRISSAAVSCNSTPDEIRDLFLQGFDMVTAVTSEVKFFEVKLDEYAPSVPMTKVSDVRYYSGM